MSAYMFEESELMQHTTDESIWSKGPFPLSSNPTVQKPRVLKNRG